MLCLLLAMLVGRQGAAPAALPCTDVQIIGLRGSGEPMDAAQHNMGALLGPVADEIASLASDGTTISFYGLPYRAVSVNAYTLLSEDYFASVHEGQALLHNYLVNTISACPSMKFVVMGYSQGSHAAGDQLAKEPTSVTDRVSTLVLFADPRFNPDVSYAYGSYDPRDHGVAGPRSTSDFSTWSARVGSWCNQNDRVCQGLGVGHTMAQHAQQLYFDNYGHIVASFTRKRLGWPVKGFSQPLDLAFAIDSTGSMAGAIQGAKTAAHDMAQVLAAQSPDFHVGLVDYKDTDQGDPYGARVDTPFTSSIDDLTSGLSTVFASGGGDFPEAVYDGIMTAVNQLSWRNGARKAIVVIGDAPGKDPEPVTGFTRAQVLAAAQALDPAVIYPITVGSGLESFFQPLADGSGGQLFVAPDPSQVSSQVLAAVQTASVPLVAALTVSNPTRTGSPTLFSAAGSFYGTDGSIVAYDWDFNGDGVVDETTSTSRTSHTYPSAYSGTAFVTVHTDDGHRATTVATVDVRDDAPIPVGPPVDVTGVAGSDGSSLTFDWQPPGDLGGGSVASYGVLLTNTVTGELVGFAEADASTLLVTFTGLPGGQYTGEVWATTEAGEGQHASVTASLFTYQFTGFFSPVANLPTWNRAKPGLAVPLKFSLNGFQGLEVLASGSPTSTRVDCTTGQALGNAERALPAGGSVLTYDKKSGAYTFSWKTAASWIGTCRQLDLRLKDSSIHSARFLFR